MAKSDDLEEYGEPQPYEGPFGRLHDFVENLGEGKGIKIAALAVVLLLLLFGIFFFVVSPASSGVSIRVSDSHGKPLNGAIVRLYDGAGNLVGTAKSANGTVQFNGLPNSKYAYTVSLDGYETAKGTYDPSNLGSASVTLKPLGNPTGNLNNPSAAGSSDRLNSNTSNDHPPSDPGQTVLLPTGGGNNPITNQPIPTETPGFGADANLTVSVRDVSNNQPIFGAVVSLYDGSTQAFLVQGESDSKGNLHARVKLGASITIKTRAQNYAPAEPKTVSINGLATQVDVVLAGASSGKAATSTILVVDSYHAPVPGALVQIDSSLPVVQQNTDADGKVTALLQTGVNYSVRASKSGYQDALQSLAAGTAIQLVLRTVDSSVVPASLTVSLLESNGLPSPAGLVGLFNKTNASYVFLSAMTANAQGIAVVEGLQANWTVKVNATSSHGLPSVSKEVTLASGSNSIQLAFPALTNVAGTNGTQGGVTSNSTLNSTSGTNSTSGNNSSTASSSTGFSCPDGTVCAPGLICVEQAKTSGSTTSRYGCQNLGGASTNSTNGTAVGTGRGGSNQTVVQSFVLCSQSVDGPPTHATVNGFTYTLEAVNGVQETAFEVSKGSSVFCTAYTPDCVYQLGTQTLLNQLLAQRTQVNATLVSIDPKKHCVQMEFSVPCAGDSCQQTPTTCPLTFDPVCASNGVTYSNDCQAALAKAGASVSGACIATCSNQADPVCADNGIQYVNACQAVAENQTYKAGICQPPNAGLFTDVPAGWSAVAPMGNGALLATDCTTLNRYVFQGYDASRNSYSPVKPSFGAADPMQYATGYFVYSQKSCRIYWNDQPASEPYQHTLSAGWNLVGAPQKTIQVKDVLGTCANAKVWSQWGTPENTAPVSAASLNKLSYADYSSTLSFAPSTPNLLIGQWASNATAIEIDHDGNLVWSFTPPYAPDGTPDSQLANDYMGFMSARRLPNGNTLVYDGHFHAALVVNPSGKIVWNYTLMGTSGTVVNLQRLANGNTLISDDGIYGYEQQHPGFSRAYQAIEVDPNGNLVWNYSNPSLALTAQRLSNGDTLINYGNPLVEVDSSGKTVWTYAGGAVSAVRMQNSNTLISDPNHNRIIQVDFSGNVVWQFDTNNPGIVQPLSNGHILFVNTSGMQLNEVDPSKNVVFQFPTRLSASIHQAPNGVFGSVQGVDDATQPLAPGYSGTSLSSSTTPSSSLWVGTPRLQLPDSNGLYACNVGEIMCGSVSSPSISVTVTGAGGANGVYNKAALCCRLANGIHPTNDPSVLTAWTNALQLSRQNTGNQFVTAYSSGGSQDGLTTLNVNWTVQRSVGLSGPADSNGVQPISPDRVNSVCAQQNLNQPCYPLLVNTNESLCAVGDVGADSYACGVPASTLSQFGASPTPDRTLYRCVYGKPGLTTSDFLSGSTPGAYLTADTCTLPGYNAAYFANLGAFAKVFSTQVSGTVPLYSCFGSFALGSLINYDSLSADCQATTAAQQGIISVTITPKILGYAYPQPHEGFVPAYLCGAKNNPILDQYLSLSNNCEGIVPSVNLNEGIFAYFFPLTIPSPTPSPSPVSTPTPKPPILPIPTPTPTPIAVSTPTGLTQLGPQDYLQPGHGYWVQYDGSAGSTCVLTNQPATSSATPTPTLSTASPTPTPGLTVTPTVSAGSATPVPSSTASPSPSPTLTPTPAPAVVLCKRQAVGTCAPSGNLGSQACGTSCPAGFTAATNSCVASGADNGYGIGSCSGTASCQSDETYPAIGQCNAGDVAIASAQSDTAYIYACKPKVIGTCAQDATLTCQLTCPSGFTASPNSCTGTGSGGSYGLGSCSGSAECLKTQAYLTFNGCGNDVQVSKVAASGFSLCRRWAVGTCAAIGTFGSNACGTTCPTGFYGAPNSCSSTGPAGSYGLLSCAGSAQCLSNEAYLASGGCNTGDVKINPLLSQVLAQCKRKTAGTCQFVNNNCGPVCPIGYSSADTCKENRYYGGLGGRTPSCEFVAPTYNPAIATYPVTAATTPACLSDSTYSKAGGCDAGDIQVGSVLSS